MESDSDGTTDSDELQEIIVQAKKRKGPLSAAGTSHTKALAVSDSDSDTEVVVKRSKKGKVNAELSDSRPKCKYGQKCYLKNPDHLKNFSHEGIHNMECSDSLSEVNEVTSPDIFGHFDYSCFTFYKEKEESPGEMQKNHDVNSSSSEKSKSDIVNPNNSAICPELSSSAEKSEWETPIDSGICADLSSSSEKSKSKIAIPQLSTILTDWSATPCEWVCQNEKMYLQYETQIDEAILGKRSGVIDVENVGLMRKEDSVTKKCKFKLYRLDKALNINIPDLSEFFEESMSDQDKNDPLEWNSLFGDENDPFGGNFHPGKVKVGDSHFFQPVPNHSSRCQKNKKKAVFTDSDLVAQLFPRYPMPKLSEREKEKEILSRLAPLIENRYGIPFVEKMKKKTLTLLERLTADGLSLDKECRSRAVLFAGVEIIREYGFDISRIKEVMKNVFHANHSVWTDLEHLDKIGWKSPLNFRDITWEKRIPEIVEQTPPKKMSNREEDTMDLTCIPKDLDDSECFQNATSNREEDTMDLTCIPKDFDDSECFQNITTSQVPHQPKNGYEAGIELRRQSFSIPDVIKFVNTNLCEKTNPNENVVKHLQILQEQLDNLSELLAKNAHLSVNSEESTKPDFYFGVLFKYKKTFFEDDSPVTSKKHSLLAELVTEMLKSHIDETYTVKNEIAVKESMNDLSSKYRPAEESEKNIVDFAVNYFAYFQQAVLKDCELSEYLFTAILMHLKESASYFTHIHPFLLLLIFTQYPEQNVSNLTKFLTICKFLYNTNFNFGNGYIENLRNFLLFCMFNNYKKENNESILLRKNAAVFYAAVVKKLCHENFVQNLCAMEKVLKDSCSEFYSCYSALIAVKAIDLSAMAKVIPQVFEILTKKVCCVRKSHSSSVGENDRESTYVSQIDDGFFAEEIPKKKSKKRKRTSEEKCFQVNKMGKDYSNFECSNNLEQIEESLENELSNGKHVDSNEENESFDLSIVDALETVILAENEYASLMMSELLDACVQLSNNFIKHALYMEDRVFDPFFNTYLLPIRVSSVKKFVSYFGNELLHKLHLPTVHCVYKTVRKNNINAFTQMLISELKLIVKSRFH